MEEKRMIDANEVLENLDAIRGCGPTDWDEAIGEAMKRIAKHPTIDPESLRPVGQWIVKGNLGICSECGEYVAIKSKYCPNCGVRMTGCCRFEADKYMNELERGESMKPILFNTEMVQRILSGEKTVTRRVIKPQPKGAHTVMDSNNETHTFDLLCGNGGKGGIFVDWAETVKAPFWLGDILYVRETFRVDYLSNIPGIGRVHYKADDTYADFTFDPQRYDMMRRTQLKHGWRPNENAPREVARLFLRVTDVRVEQLQDMRMDAMKAEGMIPANVSGGSWQQWQRDYAQPAWDSTIKKADLDRYGWDANPWVWVIEFERCEKPEGV